MIFHKTRNVFTTFPSAESHKRALEKSNYKVLWFEVEKMIRNRIQKPDRA